MDCDVYFSLQYVAWILNESSIKLMRLLSHISDRASTVHQVTGVTHTSYFSANTWRALSSANKEKFRRRSRCNCGDRPEGINHGCQPLTLSVWSLGHTRAWWSLPGNELQEAASIIHTYESALCPLFLEMGLNEGWPYLGFSCSWYVTEWRVFVSVFHRARRSDLCGYTHTTAR